MMNAFQLFYIQHFSWYIISHKPPKNVLSRANIAYFVSSLGDWHEIYENLTGQQNVITKYLDLFFNG